MATKTKKSNKRLILRIEACSVEIYELKDKIVIEIPKHKIGAVIQGEGKE